MKRESRVSARLLIATFLVVVLGAVLFVPGGSADELYGKVRGTVIDPSGAALPEAQIQLTNIGTGIKVQTVSGPDGEYIFVNVKPGTYKVSVSKSGFKTVEFTGVNVVQNEIFVQNAKMELGTLAETIEVAATQVQVEQSSMQLTNSIDSKTVTDLPLNGRNWIFLQQTLPGVVLPDTRFNTNFSTNGSQGQQNSYLVNGNDSNDLPLNSPLAPPNPDSIEEVKMITNTINPEYGRNSGAILNAVTKSGTNSLHGSGFEFYRDTSLNVHDFFHKTPTIFHQNMFGGTFGGPIWKNKSFFFFGYQGTRARQPGANSNGTTNVFTQDELNGTWNPAKMSTKPIPFALTGSNGQACVPGVDTYATCFPTGVVPTSDYSSFSTNLVKQFVPLPNCGTGCNLYSFSPVTKLTADQYLGRFDQNFGSKDSLWFYGYANDSTTLNDIPFSGSSLPGFGDHSVPFTKQFTAAYQHTFSSNMLNELRLGYTRLNFNTGTPITVVQPSAVGFSNIFPQITQGASYPTMSITGYFALGGTSNGPQPRIDQTYQVTDNFSWTKGRHNLKFGYDGRNFRVWNPFGARNNGSFTFNNSKSSAFSSGDAGLNFLLGIPTSYNQGSGQVIIAEAYEHYMYAQDEWRIKDNLTLTFGAGYQIDTPIAEYQNAGLSRACFIPGQQSKVFPTGTAPDGNPGGAPIGYNFPGDPGCDKYGGASTKYNHIGPRLGFAYTPDWGTWTGGKGKTSIRGGFGFYFNRGEEELNLQDLGSPPIGQTSNGIGDEGHTPGFPNPWTDITGTYTMTNKFPYKAPTPGSIIDFSIYEPMGINTVDKNLTIPYAMNYNLTFERELPAATILRVGYVGAQGRKLVEAYSFNPMTPQGIQTCLTIPACATNGDQAPVNYPNLFLYPGDIWGNSGMIHTMGTSSYNSLQISAEKHMTHGLMFNTSYTYAHSLDTGSSFEDVAFLTTGSFDPYGNRSRDHGDSAFDARHRVTFVFSYEFPKAHVVQPLLNGWRISGDTVYQTGFPVNLQDSNELSLVCSPSYSFYACPDRPDVVGPVTYMDPRNTTTHQFFNTSAFADNAVGTLGTAGRGIVRGPGYWGTNFSVQKDTHITESKFIQLRLEIFNLFNHANFANPVGDFSAANFGQITSLRPFVNSGPSPEGSRLIQLGAKFIF